MCNTCGCKEAETFEVFYRLQTKDGSTWLNIGDFKKKEDAVEAFNQHIGKSYELRLVEFETMLEYGAPLETVDRLIMSYNRHGNKIQVYEAEIFEAKGYKGISASKIQVLEKYIENGGKALDYHELPYHIQRQLEMGKVHELLYQDVNRWLQDNAPNPHHAMPSWLSAETFEARENKDGTIVLSDAEFNRCRALYNGNYLWYYDELKYIDSGLKQGHKFEKVREYNSQEIALIVQYEKALREQERRLKLRFREQLRDYYGIQRGRNKVNGRIVFDSEGFEADTPDPINPEYIEEAVQNLPKEQYLEFCDYFEIDPNDEKELSQFLQKNRNDSNVLMKLDVLNLDAWYDSRYRLPQASFFGFNAETFEAKGYRNPYAFRKPKLVDTDKYKGHSEGHKNGSWDLYEMYGSNDKLQLNITPLHDKWGITIPITSVGVKDAKLIADAPMLLEEVKDGNRIKEYIYQFAQYPSIKKIHLDDLIAFIEEDDERFEAEDDLDYYNKYQNYEKNGTPIEKDGYELSWGLASLNRKELIEEILGSFEYDYLLENNMVRKIDDREEEDAIMKLNYDNLFGAEAFDASGIDTFTEPFMEMKTGSILKKVILLGSLGVGALVGKKLRK